MFDGDSLTDLQADQKNRATELIEDFMIGANGVTAKYLAQKGFPALRRVLRSPERWARIVELAKDLGERLPPHPDCQALQEFLEKRRQADPARFPDLSLSMVKLLGRGEYVLELPGQPVEGHFPGRYFTAVVSRISHSVDPATRTMPVEADYYQTQSLLDPGMFVEVLWPVRESTPSLFVPSSAIVQTATRTFVDLVEQGRIKQIAVQPVRAMGDLLQVFGDLHAGDQVLVKGSQDMTDGEQVTAVPMKVQAPR